jgi:hypothetical protein
MKTTRAFSILTWAPRLMHLGSIAAFGYLATGCVAAKHYEEARTIAETEQTAHGRTRARLEAAVERVNSLEQELQKREQALALGQSAIEESKLATNVALKEKEAATMLVEQLRSDLARTGENLSTFSREKRDMQQTLLLAEQRTASVEAASRNLGELVGTARDLALELDQPLTAGTVSLFAKDGRVVLGMTSDKLFSSTGDALIADAAPVLTAAGKVSQAHPTLRVFVREPSGAPITQARLQVLAQALRERGVAETKLVVESCPAPAPAAAVPAAAPATPASRADEDNIPVADTPAAATPTLAAAPTTNTNLALYEIAFAP